MRAAIVTSLLAHSTSFFYTHPGFSSSTSSSSQFAQTTHNLFFFLLRAQPFFPLGHDLKSIKGKTQIDRSSPPSLGATFDLLHPLLPHSPLGLEDEQNHRLPQLFISHKPFDFGYVFSPFSSFHLLRFWSSTHTMRFGVNNSKMMTRM